MNPRKSHKADLERKRKYFFAFGLILSVLVVYGASAIQLGAFSIQDDEGLLNPSSFEEQMRAAIQINKPKPPAIKLPPRLDKIKVVQNTEPVKEPLKLDVENTPETPNESALSKKLYQMMDGDLYTTLEQMPSFPGGVEARDLFINKNFRIPLKVMQEGIQGTVVVSYIVEKDGTLTNFKIEQSLCDECDAEVLRVFKKMPKHIPGKQGGEARRVILKHPVGFYLSTKIK